MTKDQKETALKEIHETLKSCNKQIRTMGLSFIDTTPSTLFGKMKVFLSLVMALSMLFTMLIGEFAFTASLVATHSSLEDFLGSYLHIAGYDTMSFGKLLTVWYKRSAFRRLVNELPDLWPVVVPDKESAEIKRSSLSTLKFVQNFYIMNTYVGLWGYNLTPLILYCFFRIRGTSTDVGFIWHVYYPFETTSFLPHAFAYVYEMFAGQFSVCAMVGADLLFITMASHISMLLRLLQVKVRNLAKKQEKGITIKEMKYQDCYADIVDLVKVHQRLISYGNDLEDAFSAVNLINLLLSSVNLCCCLFNVVFLNPWQEMNDKIFVIIALAQMGMICWYADDIARASAGVADAVYKSGWYDCNARCRRAMLVLLQRSQKPLHFTALKFKAITMTTYGSMENELYLPQIEMASLLLVLRFPCYFMLKYCMVIAILGFLLLIFSGDNIDPGRTHGHQHGDTEADKLSAQLLNGENCSKIKCSNIVDYVCGVARKHNVRVTKLYQNICYLDQARCRLKHQLDIYQVPDHHCNISAEILQVKRRVNDFSIVGAHQVCNHTCPTHCVDTYEPACAKIWTRPTTYKLRAMINHCHIDLLSCAAGVNVTVEPLVRCYRNPSALIFMMQVAALKSLRLIDDPSHTSGRRSISQWTAENRLNRMLQRKWKHQR